MAAIVQDTLKEVIDIEMVQTKERKNFDAAFPSGFLVEVEPLKWKESKDYLICLKKRHFMESFESENKK